MGMLASLIAGLATGETVAALRRTRTAAVVYLFAAVAGVVGLSFFLAAAFMWAERRYGAIEAALGFGAGFVVLALLVLAVFRLTSGSRARKQARRRRTDLTALGATAALGLLPTLARGKPGPGLILWPLATLAAYAIYRENAGPSKDDDDPGEGV
jgi:chromate transport protein ChrA